MHRILTNQNDNELINILIASEISYNKAKKIEFNLLVSIIILAIVYPVAYTIDFYNKEIGIKFWAFLSSFVFSIIYLAYTYLLKEKTKIGAKLKDEFDEKLFNLKIYSFEKHLPVDKKNEILQNNKLSKDDFKYWYPINISEFHNANIAIAICQYFNTKWDLIIRYDFRKYLYGFIIVYFIMLLLLSILIIKNIETCLQLFFSTYTVFSYFVTQLKGNKSSLNIRNTIAVQLEEKLTNKESTKLITLEFLQEVQRIISIARQEPVKVLNFIHNKRKDSCYEILTNSIDEINIRITK